MLLESHQVQDGAERKDQKHASATIFDDVQLGAVSSHICTYDSVEAFEAETVDWGCPFIIRNASLLAKKVTGTLDGDRDSDSELLSLWKMFRDRYPASEQYVARGKASKTSATLDVFRVLCKELCKNANLIQPSDATLLSDKRADREGVSIGLLVGIQGQFLASDWSGAISNWKHHVASAGQPTLPLIACVCGYGTGSSSGCQDLWSGAPDVIVSVLEDLAAKADGVIPWTQGPGHSLPSSYVLRVATLASVLKPCLALHTYKSSLDVSCNLDSPIQTKTVFLVFRDV